MGVAVERNPVRDHDAGGVDPGIPDMDFGGGGAGWVELLKARDDIEAHLVTGRLSESGVETRTLKDRSGPAWLFGGHNPWAPVTILVRKVQLEDARIVLAEISFQQPAVDPEAPVPEAPGRSRAVAWWAIALALGLGFTTVALARTADSIRGCDIPIICGGASEAGP
jgi:hypothetical protein